MQYSKPGRAMRALAQDRVAAQLMGVEVDRYSMIGFALGAMLAGIVGGLLVTITGVNSGIGGPISIKAFMMVMIGGAGVVGGAIAGGFILGMMESVGLTVLRDYGDITYLVIFAALMVFLSIRPQRADGQAVGVMEHDAQHETSPRSPSSSLIVFVVVPWLIAATGRTDLYYTLTSVALLSIASAGVWLTFYIGRINIGQGAYALMGGYVSAILVVDLWLVVLADAAARRPVLRRCERADRPADPAAARRLFRHGDAGADRGGAAAGAGAADHQRRQGHGQHPAARRAVELFGLTLIPDFATLANPRLGLLLRLAVVADGAVLCRRCTGWSIRASGKLCQSLQQNEELASSIGVNIAYLRVIAYAISSFLGGIAGAMFVAISQSIYPSSFTVTDSVNFMLNCFLGGLGYVFGPMLGTWSSISAGTSCSRPASSSC